MAEGFITAAKSASQPRRAFIAGALTVLVLFLLSSPLVTASTPDRGPRSAVIRTGERRGVRFNSGLTTCDEDLRNGRWVNRSWGSNGQIVPDIHLDGGRQQMDMLPIDAFKLEIERQELSGSWKWIGAEQSEVRNPDGPLVTVELESTFRPIRVRIHTFLSGGLESGSWLPGLERKLEGWSTKPKSFPATAASPSGDTSEMLIFESLDANVAGRG